jgi:hypothetical protein
MASVDDGEPRIAGFAVGPLAVYVQLPKASEGTHIANRLPRSGTAGARDYEETLAAESAAEFIHEPKTGPNSCVTDVPLRH